MNNNMKKSTPDKNDQQFGLAFSVLQEGLADHKVELIDIIVITNPHPKFADFNEVDLYTRGLKSCLHQDDLPYWISSYSCGAFQRVWYRIKVPPYRVEMTIARLSKFAGIDVVRGPPELGVWIRDSLGLPEGINPTSFDTYLCLHERENGHQRGGCNECRRILARMNGDKEAWPVYLEAEKVA